jgi:Zn-dependent protease
MLRGGIPIGKIFGISIRLHYSWFFIFALITWALAANYFPSTHPTWSLSMKIGAGLVTSFLFFGSVLLHELMHSLVALREGIQIQSITLFILGGVSQMTGEPRTAKDEFRMAGAGPLSSLVLGGIFFGIYFALRSTTTEAAQFIAAITHQ